MTNRTCASFVAGPGVVALATGSGIPAVPEEPPPPHDVAAKATIVEPIASAAPLMPPLNPCCFNRSSLHKCELALRYTVDEGSKMSDHREEARQGLLWRFHVVKDGSRKSLPHEGNPPAG